MRNRTLAYAQLRAPRFEEELRADQCALAPEITRTKQALREQLEGAVGVANTKPQDEVHECRPSPSPQATPPPVAPIDPVARDHIVVPEHMRRLRKLAKVELPVSVCQKDQVHGSSIETRADRGAISSIAEMSDNRQLGDAALQRFQDLRGVIRAAVVHDDDLQLRGQPSPYFGRLADHPSNVAFLVETGNHHGKSHRREPNAKGETLAR